MGLGYVSDDGDPQLRNGESGRVSLQGTDVMNTGVAAKLRQGIPHQALMVECGSKQCWPHDPASLGQVAELLHFLIRKRDMTQSIGGW